MKFACLKYNTDGLSQQSVTKLLGPAGNFCQVMLYCYSNNSNMKNLKNRLKLTIKKTLLICLSVAFLSIPASSALAAFADPNTGQTNPPTSGGTQTDPNCNNSSDAGINKCLQKNQIVVDINKIVDFLAGGVGIVVIGTIILGGIQYSMAGDNAQATTAARQRITNGLIALAAFIFAFAFLQWLIPGGL